MARPNPIHMSDYSGLGVTRLSWKSLRAEAVEVHVDYPDGPLFSSTSPSGSEVTGNWVRDGMIFYLQDVSGGLPLTSDNTIDSIIVNVIRAK